MHQYETLYVYYPRGLRTGGPEALHQLVDALRRTGQEAFLTPLPGSEGRDRVAEYLRYDAPEAAYPSDRAGCAVLAPETALWALRRIRKAERICWWLSIDNARVFARERAAVYDSGAIVSHVSVIANLRETVRRARDKRMDWRGIKHLAQSHYAWHYLYARLDIVPTLLSDFTPLDAFAPTSSKAPNERGLTIAFNPAKGGRFIAQLKGTAPHFTYVPLAHMPRRAVLDTLAETAVYLDLGHHPGKDRMPREAAIAGAVVLSARRGAAANSQDMPIPWRHKIDMQGDVSANALQCLNAAFEDLQGNWLAQSPYRDAIAHERQRFRAEVESTFVLGHWGSDGLDAAMLSDGR